MNLPKEFCDRMEAMPGLDLAAFLHSYETEIYRGVRINTQKCSDTAALAAELGLHEAVEWCGSGYYCGSLLSGSHPYHAAGLLYFQEPSAMCAAEALPLRDNMRVLDLCAAPGGKTTHIAARMNNSGLLISNEIIPKRAAVLAENVERMGLKNTIVTNESPQRLAEKFPSFFDAVIVDAPCSGEGMFRKEPQAIQAWSVEHTLSCAARQKMILANAYEMLRPGGYLLYSTCTFSRDENETVIEHMILDYGMELCEIPRLAMLSAGVGSFPEIEKCRRIFPHLQKGEGHFAALLKKSENAEDTSSMVTPPRGGISPDAERLWREFERETLNIKLRGELVLFGDNLYLMPVGIDTAKLKILRCGLHLGVIKKGRFEPAHALSHALPAKAFRSFIEFDASSDEIKKYMHGEVIPGSTKGWCVVGTRGAGIGWGKASGGMIKNHYPKPLRTQHKALPHLRSNSL